MRAGKSAALSVSDEQILVSLSPAERNSLAERVLARIQGRIVTGRACGACGQPIWLPRQGEPPDDAGQPDEEEDNQEEREDQGTPNVSVDPVNGDSSECPSPLVRYDKSSRAPNSIATSTDAESVDNSVPRNPSSKLSTKSSALSKPSQGKADTFPDLVEHTPPTKRCTRQNKNEKNPTGGAISSKTAPTLADSPSLCSDEERIPGSTSTPLKKTTPVNEEQDQNSSQSVFSDSQDSPIKKTVDEFRSEKTRIDESASDGETTVLASPIEESHHPVNGHDSSLLTGDKDNNPQEESNSEEGEESPIKTRQSKRKAVRSLPDSNSDEDSCLKTRKVKKRAKKLLNDSSSDEEDSPLKDNQDEKEVEKSLKNLSEDEESPLKANQVEKEVEKSLENSSADEDSKLNDNQVGKSKISSDNSGSEQDDSAANSGKKSDKRLEDSSGEESPSLKSRQTKTKAKKLLKDVSSSDEANSPLKAKKVKRKAQKSLKDSSSDEEDSLLKANPVKKGAKGSNVGESDQEEATLKKANRVKKSINGVVSSEEDSSLKSSQIKKRAKKKLPTWSSEDESPESPPSGQIKKKVSKSTQESSTEDELNTRQSKKKPKNQLNESTVDKEANDSELKTNQTNKKVKKLRQDSSSDEDLALKTTEAKERSNNLTTPEQESFEGETATNPVESDDSVIKPNDASLNTTSDISPVKDQEVVEDQSLFEESPAKTKSLKKSHSSGSAKEENSGAQLAKRDVLQGSSSSESESSSPVKSAKESKGLESKAKEAVLQDSESSEDEKPSAKTTKADLSASDPGKSEESDSLSVKKKTGNLERSKLSKEERLKRRTRFLIRKINVATDSKLNGKPAVELDTLSIAILQDLEDARRVHVKDYPQLRKLCRSRKSKADPNIDRLCNLSNIDGSSGRKSKKIKSKLLDNGTTSDENDDENQASRQISPSKRKRDRRRKKEKALNLLDVSSAEEAQNSEVSSNEADESKGSKLDKPSRFDGLKNRNDLAKSAILDSTSGSDNNDKTKKMNGQGDSNDSSSDEVQAKNGEKKTSQKKSSGSKNESNETSEGKRKRKDRKDPNFMRMKLSETDSSEAEEKAKARRLKNDKKAKDKDESDHEKSADNDDDEKQSSDDSGEIFKTKKGKRKRNKNRIQDSDNEVDASDFEADDCDADSADSDSDIEVVKKRGPGKKRKKRNGNDSSDVLSNGDDDEDDDDDDDESRPKKKKRKRIKKNSSSDEDADSDADSPNKGGRKDIRKIISEKKLSQSTKTAAADEKDRRKRMEERQKLYNQTFEIKEGETQEELPLDFDEETKEVLVEVPSALVKKLKPHQVNGVKFMWDAVFESKKMVEEGKVPGGAILAHCMGLGKTLQTITLVSTVHEKFPGRVSRTLVLCPVNTVKNWEDEFAKWLKGDLEMDVYEMSKEKDNWGRSDRLKVWHQEGGVLIMGYDMFRNLTNEAKKYNRKQRDIFQKSLCDPGPDLVVCDEGHVLKNLKSALNKAMNKIKTKRRILLTGTPLQNNLSEYFAMVNFVKPQLLGTFNEFKNRFVNPIQNGQHSDSTDRDVRVMKKRSFILSDLLKGCMQRLDYNVLVPYLQPKHEFVLCICLTDFQKKLYSYYLENFARAGQIGTDGKLEGGKKGGLFYDVQNLSRVWNHPHILAMAKSRADLKAMDESDENMDDADETGNLQGFIDDDEASETPNSSEDDAHTTSEDEIRIEREVVNKKVTRSQQDSEIVKGLDEAKSEALANQEGWWGQFLSEDNELDRLENGSKMLILMDILKECEMLGDKVLVFSQSLLSLDLIEDFLARAGQSAATAEDSTLMSYLGTWVHGKDYFRMDGSTPPDTRKKWCNYFNKTTNHRMRLFLISTKAGGLGINLVAANRVIIFDASWNPAHDVQSIFRVYRFGQTKPVYIYRFLAKGTMEEKIYDRQVTKQSLSARVVDEHQIERHFSVNELATLYEFQDEPIESRPVPKVPKDRLLAELLTKHDKLIWKYHDHDSLLENQVDENLTEEERKAAWEEFENEKKGLVTGVDPAVQALLAQSINPQAIQQQYRLQYPHLSEEQIIQATRALIMQMQSGIHRRPAYDKSHYQQEMARARQQEKALYPGMYRKTDKFTSNMTHPPNSEAWHAQVMQQQRQYSQMQQMQQQIQQSRLQQMQMLQAQLSQINPPQTAQLGQLAQDQQEPEEIVLDGSPVMGEPLAVSAPRPSTSRRGRPRLDPDSDLY